MSYPKNSRDRRSQTQNDRSNPLSPNSQRIYRPKNHVSPAPPELATSPISPSSWNSRMDYMSTSAPGRDINAPVASTSVPSHSSSYTPHYDPHQNIKSPPQPPHHQNKNNSKQRSQSFGTSGGNPPTVSYMRKLTNDDIKKICEKVQSSFWSGEESSTQSPSLNPSDLDQPRNLHRQPQWSRDPSLTIPIQRPNKIPLVTAKKNSVRGKTFVVFEGEPEERGSCVWIGLNYEINSIRAYDEGEEYFGKASTYMLRRIRSFLQEKGGINTINYQIQLDTEKPNELTIVFVVTYN